MKSRFLTQLGLLSLVCGMTLALPAPFIQADDNVQSNSTATLTLDSNDTHLSLDAVPSFPFGTVKAGDLLSGKTLTANLSNNNKVTVTDTRLDSKGWQLAVTTTAFTNNGKTGKTGKTIAGTLGFTPAAFSFADDKAADWTWADTKKLALPNNTHTLIASSTGDQEGTATANIDQATFNATSHDALASGEYTSTLTWNLTANSDPAASN